MPIAEDGWLSERVGCPVFTLDADASAAELAEHGRSAGRAMYQAKLPTTSVERVRELCRAGMYPVDVAVTLEADPAAIAGPSSDDVRVGQALPDQGEALRRVAETSFRYSRFHLDPGVAMAAADRIKRDWIDSYLRGTRGDELLVAHVDGRVAGFLAVLVDRGGDPPARVIDLVAVSEEARGRGAARALSARVAADAQRGSEIVRVGTQAANVNATRMYERLGFRVARTSYTLHMHLGGAA